jgi:hypothetical protein
MLSKNRIHQFNQRLHKIILINMKKTTKNLLTIRINSIKISNKSFINRLEYYQ